jgi:hypothetical protein
MAKENLLDLLRKATDLLGDLNKKQNNNDSNDDEDNDGSIGFSPSDVFKLVGLSNEDEIELMINVGAHKCLEAIIKGFESTELTVPRAIVSLLLVQEKNVLDIKELYEKISKQKGKKQ